MTDIHGLWISSDSGLSGQVGESLPALYTYIAAYLPTVGTYLGK